MANATSWDHITGKPQLLLAGIKNLIKTAICCKKRSVTPHTESVWRHMSPYSSKELQVSTNCASV